MAWNRLHLICLAQSIFFLNHHLAFNEQFDLLWNFLMLIVFKGIYFLQMYYKQTIHFSDTIAFCNYDLSSLVCGGFNARLRVCVDDIMTSYRLRIGGAPIIVDQHSRTTGNL